MDKKFYKHQNTNRNKLDLIKTILVSCLLLLGLNAQGQLTKTDSLKRLLETSNKDTIAWVKGGVFVLGTNQGFLHNWPAGGELISMNVNGQFNGYLNRIYHNQVWANNLDITYALMYAYSNNFKPRKMDDRIDFTSKYGVKIGKSNDYYFSVLANFKTQFTQGFDYKLADWVKEPTSTFFSPAYFTGALGFDFRKGSNLTLFLSPAASRITVANSYYTSLKPEGAFGIAFGKSSRYELGAYFTGRIQAEINKKFIYKTRLDFYSNYLAKDKKDDEGNVISKDNPGNIDVLWDNFLSYKFSKYLGVTFSTTLIYDNDIPYKIPSNNNNETNEPGKALGWWQFKQMMTIGLEYRL